MSKLIGLSDYILLSAAVASGVFEDVVDTESLYPNVKMKQYGYFPLCFNSNCYSVTISKLITKNEIKRALDDNGNIYLCLREKGRKKLVQKFPLYFKKGRTWDGCFVLVIFDIKETNRRSRNCLRRKLNELGFGMMQRSIWISPYHFENLLQECINKYNLHDAVFILKDKKLGIKNLKQFARCVWKLDRVEKSYQSIMEKSAYLENLKNSGDGLKRDLVASYFKTLSIDPLLPKEFLPSDWPQSSALSIISRFD